MMVLLFIMDKVILIKSGNACLEGFIRGCECMVMSDEISHVDRRERAQPGNG